MLRITDVHMGFTGTTHKGRGFLPGPHRGRFQVGWGPQSRRQAKEVRDIHYLDHMQRKDEGERRKKRRKREK